jgi:nucleotidyltransferase substrate binding protein (TIGR01987 family)
MADEFTYSLGKFGDALQQLQKGLAAVNDDLTRDGVIKRFEYTFELMWKTLKIRLKDEGVDARTPREVLKGAFKLHWLPQEEVFITMLKDRNDLAHTYKEEKIKEVYGHIKTDYVDAIEAVYNTLKA